MSDTEQGLAAKHQRVGVPMFRGPMHDVDGNLNRSAMRWIVENSLPVVHLGLLSAKRDDDGMPVDVMLLNPRSRNKKHFRQFAKAVTQHNLWTHYNHFILAAEAIDIRSKYAPQGSWVLHLAHRAYPKAGVNKFRVLNGLLLRVDPVPLELYSQLESPGPIRKQEGAERLEHYTKHTTIDEAVKMTERVQYGELHTSRRFVSQPARFFRLYARDVVHQMQPRQFPNEPQDYPLLC